MKQNIYNRITCYVIVYSSPVLVFAAPPSNFKEFVGWSITTIINPTTALLIGLAVAYFFWGVLRYILAQGAQIERAKGVQLMTRGIIALFFIITFWGFAKMLMRTFLAP